MTDGMNASCTELDRETVLLAAEKTMDRIRTERARMREDEIQRQMRPRFWRGGISRERAVVRADHPASALGPIWEFYAWQTMLVARHLKQLAEASTADFVTVTASDFEHIVPGWKEATRSRTGSKPTSR
jgi:hypothetical protein